MLGTDYPFPLGEQAPGAGIDALRARRRRAGAPVPRHRAGMAGPVARRASHDDFARTRDSTMTDATMTDRPVLRRPRACARRRRSAARRCATSSSSRSTTARDQAYFCGNSLGLQPRGARAHVEEVLDKWATRGGRRPFHRPRASGCPTTSWCANRWRALVGAQPQRSGGDELADRQPAPDDGQLLPARRASAPRS